MQRRLCLQPAQLLRRWCAGGAQVVPRPYSLLPIHHLLPQRRSRARCSAWSPSSLAGVSGRGMLCPAVLYHAAPCVARRPMGIEVPPSVDNLLQLPAANLLVTQLPCGILRAETPAPRLPACLIRGLGLQRTPSRVLATSLGLPPWESSEHGTWVAQPHSRAPTGGASRMWQCTWPVLQCQTSALADSQLHLTGVATCQTRAELASRACCSVRLGIPAPPTLCPTRVWAPCLARQLGHFSPTPAPALLGPSASRCSYYMSLGILCGLIVLAMPWAATGLSNQLGRARKQNVTFAQLFDNKPNINILSLSRVFLFGARDLWFEVPLPFFLRRWGGVCGQGAPASLEDAGQSEARTRFVPVPLAISPALASPAKPPSPPPDSVQPRFRHWLVPLRHRRLPGHLDHCVSGRAAMETTFPAARD